MREIFIDTSAWYAIEDASDENHESALLFKEKIIAERYNWVTTNYILDETYTLLLDKIGYTDTVRFRQNINEISELEILAVVHISESMAENAWEVFEKYNIDKQWSFTDCTSKVVMEQREITEVFAFDHHFEQMGFVRKPYR